MTVLLDTDVLIDCLRGTPAARVWLEQAESQAFQVPGVVAMELLMGCRNKVELERARCATLPPSAAYVGSTIAPGAPTPRGD